MMPREIHKRDNYREEVQPENVVLSRIKVFNNENGIYFDCNILIKFTCTEQLIVKFLIFHTVVSDNINIMKTTSNC